MFGIQKSNTPKMSTLTHRLKIRKLSFEKPPLEIFSKLYNNYENVYILESIEGPKKLSQYSFIGFDPTLTITIKNGEAVIRNERTGEEERKKVKEPLAVIQKTLKNRPGFKEQRFVGGAVGYISYDAVRCWEKLPERAFDDQNFPDIEVGVFDDGLAECLRLQQHCGDPGPLITFDLDPGERRRGAGGTSESRRGLLGRAVQTGRIRRSPGVCKYQ